MNNDNKHTPPLGGGREGLCTGDCKILSLVEIAICNTCGWIEDPPAPGDPYTNNKNQ